MKILIVDDHALLREGIAALLTSQGFSVVGMAGSGEEALEALETLQPNVVLMDIGLPGMSGMQATKLILERHPEVSVVALSGQTERRYVVDMLAAGARGYVTKGAAFEELSGAIRAVAAGRAFVSQSVTDLILRDYTGKRPHSDEDATLSKREEDVLKGVADGKTSREIGDTLGLSVTTVDSHRRHISQKLGITSVAGLTKFAIRQGLTSVNSSEFRESEELAS